ncbi:hypothetical protein WDU94_007080 [Cyamophila willieti]
MSEESNKNIPSWLQELSKNRPITWVQSNNKPCDVISKAKEKPRAVTTLGLRHPNNHDDVIVDYDEDDAEDTLDSLEFERSIKNNPGTLDQDTLGLKYERLDMQFEGTAQKSRQNNQKTSKLELERSNFVDNDMEFDNCGNENEVKQDLRENNFWQTLEREVDIRDDIIVAEHELSRNFTDIEHRSFTKAYDERWNHEISSPVEQRLRNHWKDGILDDADFRESFRIVNETFETYRTNENNSTSWDKRRFPQHSKERENSRELPPWLNRKHSLDIPQFVEKTKTEESSIKFEKSLENYISDLDQFVNPFERPNKTDESSNVETISRTKDGDGFILNGSPKQTHNDASILNSNNLINVSSLDRNSVLENKSPQNRRRSSKTLDFLANADNFNIAKPEVDLPFFYELVSPVEQTEFVIENNDFALNTDGSDKTNKFSSTKNGMKYVENQLNLTKTASPKHIGSKIKSEHAESEYDDFVQFSRRNKNKRKRKRSKTIELKTLPQYSPDGDTNNDSILLKHSISATSVSIDQSNLFDSKNGQHANIQLFTDNTNSITKDLKKVIDSKER